MKIQIINPNTSSAMTDKILSSADNVAAKNTIILASNPAGGPVSIEGHFDEAISTVGVLEEVQAGEKAGVDAYVIACFGDPGLFAARELTNAPVIGIAEAAFHLATLISSQFSIVTTLERTCFIAEHLLLTYGFEKQCRRVRAAQIPVLDLVEIDNIAYEIILSECRSAKENDKIGSIVLGCGAMSDITDKLQNDLQIPVIDGVTAAVKLAESLVSLGLGTSKHGEFAYPEQKQFKGNFTDLSR